MCGGGTPPAPAPIPDHYAEEVARQDRERREREERATSARTTATASARSEAEAEAVRRGLNPADYQSLIDREISQILGLIPQDEQTPGSFFTNFGSNVFSEEESGLRARSVADVNRIAPAGFARANTPDTIVDPIIESIIGEQYNEALRGVDAARSRGALTDVGYGAATGSLGTSRGGARAQFDPIVSSVLSGARGAQEDVAGLGRERAGGLSLGQTFDLSGLESDIRATEAREEDAIPGRIRALGPTDLFDIQSLLNFGGTAQGGQNAPILSLPRDEQRRREQQRGLGTQGAF